MDAFAPPFLAAMLYVPESWKTSLNTTGHCSSRQHTLKNFLQTLCYLKNNARGLMTQIDVENHENKNAAAP